MITDYQGDLDNFLKLVLEYKAVHDKLNIPYLPLVFSKEFKDRLWKHLGNKYELRKPQPVFPTLFGVRIEVKESLHGW